ncbi:MAG: multifunctional oxoglutarate decarboxylase/oxoglutarate dehydrogenase thiamine pyrophosphate-binding subunit/dihydrolipoyllysine-residue succinyltransferase subunit [Ignavibacteria bacterium]|nr:multifunctional oxoglutarate decarboxylase/oxoglutarate dehydrogenase thiamine pyrophosphate-binding subunit/dihydrolipoyllysine-residue succinyltransferase subunit [Ignavibacteria bacterium]
MNIESLTKEQQDRILEFGVNKWYVMELLKSYVDNPDSVNDEWKDFFQSINIETSPSDSGIKKAGRTQTEPQSEKQVSAPNILAGEDAVPIRGAAARIIENMDSSLSIPTATSMRTMSARVLEENRRILNKYMKQEGRGKLSYTHIIGWAIVQAVKDIPVMNNAFTIVENEPVMIKRRDINIGLAIDLIKKDGSRTLIVPNIKKSDSLNFKEYYEKYNDIILRARTNKIEVSDFQGTTISLTNPGTIGTNFSNPRLMTGQGTIVAAGNIDYPPGFQAASPEVISKLGISKIMNITSTYDHRIIQGAESGLFLKRMSELLEGADDFYDNIFADLEIPAKPVKWSPDVSINDFGGIRNLDEIEKQTRVIKLINMYRVRGHLISNLDPLYPRGQYHPELDPANYGFTIWDYEREFSADELGGHRIAKLRDILDMLQQTYCNKIGVEYMHIQEPEEKLWLQKNMESVRNSPSFNSHVKKRILYKLARAEYFEKFIDRKYLGHKRFSLEGSETLIPVIDYILENAAEEEVEEVIMGMAHRGRLNVLANIIGKPLDSIFSEFEDIVNLDSVQGSGDVKYHLGASGIYETMDGNKIRVTVASNPSHLEFVNSVVEGIVRAKQTNNSDSERNKFIPLLLHGDAAFAGEGIVAETLNLSQLKGYRTGGTIHIIINNQIGFTTSPADARSSQYATDVAKMVQAPIFHVNGDDPEAAMWVIKLAYEYRMKFHKDVVIDMYAYRRLGHNETDEPGFTHPVMYRKIRSHNSVKEIYQEKLIKEKIIDADELKQINDNISKDMESGYGKLHQQKYEFKTHIPLSVSVDKVNELRNNSGTKISEAQMNLIAEKISNIPDDFNLHPKLKKFIEYRKDFLAKEEKIDWAFAEALAFGSLLTENISVRLSGQDSSRGTFSQRHLVLVDTDTGKEFIPLNFIKNGQAKIEPLDSLLSEAAVLGFEYGYSTSDPVTLVIWEAQFGDFANAAQVIIDNFIVSSGTKWGLPTHLTMLLPHGQEGQGSEHSSARIERFLTLCANDNMIVTNPTTPAQYFHLLRRQAKSKERRPLIIFTPKSLLRHSEARSEKPEFVNGTFMEVIDDTAAGKNNTENIILTNGKVYYDLMKYKNENEISGTAIIRIEQYYPYPCKMLEDILKSYKRIKNIRYVQEEPENMGALNFLACRFSKDDFISGRISYTSRKESASPAPGSYKIFARTQKEVIEDAFKF